MVDSSEWAAITHVVERLMQSYPSLTRDAVTAVVHQTHAKYDGRPVRDFVPMFVERHARVELAHLEVAATQPA